MSPTLDTGDRVVVTGGTGFIGSAVVRQLALRGAAVTVFTEPGANTATIGDLDVATVEVDICDRDAVEDGIAGARYVFHLAALYGFWPRDPARFYEVNVEGTINVIEAAVGADCERVVYTSSVATLGLSHLDPPVPSTEENYAEIDHLFGNYKQTKYVAEHEVLRRAAEGAPVVLVQPTMPHGPRDQRPTPTGKVVLDYLNNKMPGFVDTQLNVAHVDDLAAGHLLALEKGSQGRSYICGGENLSLASLLDSLAAVTSLPRAKHHFPKVLPLVAGHVSDFVEGALLGREPHVPLEAARMATTAMIFDDTRARSELGYTSRPAIEALYDSARWFVDHDYVDPARVAQISWVPPT